MSTQQKTKIMLKKLKTQAELTEMSAAYFEAYPDEDTFLATQDGQFFTEKNKSQANSHAKSIDCKVITIQRLADQKTETGSQKTKEEGKNILDVLSDVSGLSKDEIKKTAQEVIDSKKAASKADEPGANQDDKAGQDEGLNEEKTAEADNTEKTPVDAPADETEQVLEVDGKQLNVGKVMEKPEYKWTMEKMADWMNEWDGEFDLKDDKPALWAKVKAHYDKLTEEAEELPENTQAE